MQALARALGLGDALNVPLCRIAAAPAAAGSAWFARATRAGRHTYNFAATLAFLGGFYVAALPFLALLYMRWCMAAAMAAFDASTSSRAAEWERLGLFVMAAALPPLACTVAYYALARAIYAVLGIVRRPPPPR